LSTTERVPDALRTPDRVNPPLVTAACDRKPGWFTLRQMVVKWSRRDVRLLVVESQE
jgi:hypothetical protein